MGMYSITIQGILTDIIQTAEHLTATSLGRTSSSSFSSPLTSPRAADADLPIIKGDRAKSAFVEDEGIPEMFRAKLQDCAYN